MAPTLRLNSPPGSSRELLSLAVPLIVSQSFMAIQVLVDAVLLSWYDPLAMAASFPAVMWFWLPFALLQVTTGYTSTFVARYIGAGRPHRVGPAVWQGIHFAVLAGLLMLLLVPTAPLLVALGRHSPALQTLEVAYLRCMAFAALPMLLMAAANGFFSGRGQTWTVLAVQAFGTTVNVAFALVLIFGNLGFPALGIAGAGWATVAGAWASALFSVGLLLQTPYRRDFATLSGWRPDWKPFGRLMKYGVPAGTQAFLDVLVFHLFVQLVGRLGEAAMVATTLAVRLNMIAFLPMMGLGQAVCILVGQRLGAERPGLAEATVVTGLKWNFGYMCAVASAYLLFPEQIVWVFEGGRDGKDFEAVAAIVPGLLGCIAVYSIVESLNVTFAYALRGAGDTRFVTLSTFCLAFPVLVLPTFLVVRAGGSVTLTWWFATAHIFVTAACFYLRYRTGKWKSIPVIEPEDGERVARVNLVEAPTST